MIEIIQVSTKSYFGGTFLFHQNLVEQKRIITLLNTHLTK